MGTTGRSSLAAALLLLAATATLSAQFNGTWTVQGENATVTVTMQQDAQGNVRGTWTGAGSMQIEGMVEDGVAMGAIYNDEGGVYFEAQVQGDQMLLALIEPGADNQPDYSQMTELVLTSAGGGGVPPAAAQAANPLAGGGANPLAGGSGGDPLLGTWEGEGVQLTLQSGQGGYGGSLTVQGQSYPLAASGSGGQVRGTFTAGGERYDFQAQLTGQQLTLASGGSTYRLSKQGGGANPLAGGAAAQPAATSGESGLLGQWSCQTPEGQAQLQFASESQLVYNGESAPYQRSGNIIRVPGDWGPVEYRYQLQGDRLSFTGPDGSTSQCQRQQAGQAAAAGMAGGGGGQYNALLKGQYCSYSSSPDGGYSTTRRMFFDGVGRVTHVMLGEFDVSEGVGYGQGAGDPGSYNVTGFQRGADVYVKFDSSNDTHTFKVYVGDAQGIYELWFRDQVYSPKLCP